MVTRTDYARRRGRASVERESGLSAARRAPPSPTLPRKLRGGGRLVLRGLNCHSEGAPDRTHPVHEPVGATGKPARRGGRAAIAHPSRPCTAPRAAYATPP